MHWRQHEHCRLLKEGLLPNLEDETAQEERAYGSESPRHLCCGAECPEEDEELVAHKVGSKPCLCHGCTSLVRCCPKRPSKTMHIDCCCMKAALAEAICPVFYSLIGQPYNLLAVSYAMQMVNLKTSASLTSSLLL